MQLVILAAGVGSRFGGIKQLEPLGQNGETLMDFSIQYAQNAGFSSVIFITREEIFPQMQAHVARHWEGKMPYTFAFQPINPQFTGTTLSPNRSKPWGVTHALLSASSQISTPFALLNADDFYGKEGFVLAADFLKNKIQPHTAAIIGYSLGNTLSPNGTVSRGICEMDADNWLTAIAEHKEIYLEEPQKIVSLHEGKLYEFAADTPVSMNFWCFHPQILSDLAAEFELFVATNFSNPKAEMPLPPAIDNLKKANRLRVKVIPNTKGEWFGVTYPEDKPAVIERLSKIS